MNDEIDLSWAHPALAKSAERIFRRVRRDGEGRLNVADMRRRFGRHAVPMLDGIETVQGQTWGKLGEGWQAVLKDWGICANVSPYCIKEG